MAKGRRKASAKGEEGNSSSAPVRKRDKAAARVVADASVSPARAMQQFPMLVGTYLALHAAELAAKRFFDPRDQKRFVAIVREKVAEAVARRAALPTVRIRERVAEPEPVYASQRADREHERTR